LNGLSNESLSPKWTVTGLTKGESYKFRFRAKNSIGWSEYSDETTILAADVPETPEKPVPLAATDTSVQLQLDTVLDNGGSSITSYVLQHDSGSTGASFTTVASYVSGTTTPTLSVPADLPTAGTVYGFRFYAVNAKGQSEYSPILYAAVSDPPVASASITKDDSMSSSTSIYVTWAQVADGPSPGGEIKGYVLTVKDCQNGTEWEAFNGVSLGLTSQRAFLQKGLTPGREYKFSVVAYDSNGPGAASAVYSFYSCVPPSGLAAPTRSSSTKTTMTVDWESPTSNGGCDLTGFAVFMDDGAGGSFTEVNSASDPAVRDIPSLRSL